jgi:hypothetical protein
MSQGNRGKGTLRIVIDFGLPTAIYYVLRAAGMGIYGALLIGALVSASIGAVTFLRQRRLSGIAAYTMAMMLGSVGVAFIAGSTRFLLAREALLTGVTGIWFIASIWARRPLAYQFSRPLLEGRLRWPKGWDSLWERSPRFRRMWRISSLLWGIGTLLDAALRVLMAYTLKPDAVPALGTMLYVVTSVVLIGATNVLYVRNGIYNPHSAIYAAAPEPAPDTRVPVRSR